MTEIWFGPDGRFSLPSEYTIRYQVGALSVALHMTFDGRDVRMVGTTVTGTDLLARDLTRVRPQDHIRSGTIEHLRDRGETGGRDYQVASVYWREHVSWGSPRASVMCEFDVSRTTANTWIRASAKHYPMPGPHADGASDQ